MKYDWLLMGPPQHTNNRATPTNTNTSSNLPTPFSAPSAPCAPPAAASPALAPPSSVDVRAVGNVTHIIHKYCFLLIK